MKKEELKKRVKELEKEVYQLKAKLEEAAEKKEVTTCYSKFRGCRIKGVFQHVQKNKIEKRTTKMKKLFGILSLTLLIGCFPSEAVKTDPKPQQEWQPQKCEMCGSEWVVMPNDPQEKVPPTVEWCFNDGSYCVEGFHMLTEQVENGMSPELERRWLKHCMECRGCRCAAFDPEEWQKIADMIRKVRSDSVR